MPGARYLSTVRTALAIGLGAMVGSAAEKGLTLSRDGKSAATIVIARNARRAAQFAAYELQWHLLAISGAELPIVTDDAPVRGTRILVGDSAATAALDLTNASFGPQEYLIRFLPETLVLLGRDKDDRGAVSYDPMPSPAAIATWPAIWDEQGTMYAVYDFLQRDCGVRWFNPTESGTVCPRAPTLTVSGKDSRRQPFFRYRYAAYPGSENYDAYTGLWPADSAGFAAWQAAAFPTLRARFPDPQQYRQAKRGWVQLFRYRMKEGGELCLGNHSLYGYYDRFWEKSADPAAAALFEAKHAEWFAQGYEGRPPQLCYSSRGLIEQVAKDACEVFSGQPPRPGAVAAGGFFCVEPMDNQQFCRCPACQALLTSAPAFDPFFSNGRHSDYFFSFVNAVAREVRRTYPDKWIVTLAYMTHAAPPERVRLEPNIAVQFCFACNRLNFDRASYEHEIDLLNQWAAQEKDRPLYLWLYYTFPLEIANNGGFHCFPGFFAHAIGTQFELFRKRGVRGMFHCGYGQEVEAYVTYRLMDDPTLNVEALLDDYFGQLYGGAAGPLKQLYLAIEQTYSDPANYPDSIASGRTEGHHHQTEDIAWGWLGTEKRMAVFATLLHQAQALARTEVEKQRVTLFERGIWDYMVAGRQRYLERVKATHGAVGPAVRVPCALGGPLAGNAGKLVRDESAVLSGWRSLQGEHSRRDVEARLLHDDRYLYVQFEEKALAHAPHADADPAAAEQWIMLVSAHRQAPYRELRIDAKGNLLCREVPSDALVAPQPCDVGAVAVSDMAGRKRWTVSLALPLARLLPGGVAPGSSLFANFARLSPGSDDEPAWVPTFGALADPTRLRELVLEKADSLPASLPTAAELHDLDQRDLVARWRLDEGRGTTARDASGQGIDGTLMNGATWENERARTALRLEDQLGQYVDLGNAPAVNLSGPLTLEAWVKYQPSDTMYPAILGKGYEQSGAYSLHLRPGLTLWFELDAPDGTRHFYNPPDLTLTPDAWNHVVATYDGATMRVYINGREDGPGKAATLALRQTREPLRLGWLGSYGHFNGSLRDVALYRRPMAPGEVFARYLAGR
jgi:hypothetical protein